jgi:class 3 adenylate cyclase
MVGPEGRAIGVDAVALPASAHEPPASRRQHPAHHRDHHHDHHDYRDHADQALGAALEIAAAVEAEFAGELAIGIGLNSGTVVAGNVGGVGRLEFSVIGDAVNVAARVESATPHTGDTILVSEYTRRLLSDGRVSLEERPEVPWGKREAVALFAPSSGTLTEQLAGPSAS